MQLHFKVFRTNK